jgi:hypothetical protein
MDREGPGRPGRGGAGSAGLTDTGLADVGSHPDAETLPLARLAPGPPGVRRGLARQPAGRPRGLAGQLAAWPHGLAGQLALLTCYLATGIAVTWPRVTYLAGSLPSTRDAGAYVWGFWWLARQVTHLGSPWATSYLAAPVGEQLAYHTLMPLPSLLMTPVTLIFGPSVSYNLLSIACPGLLCYAMYRAARLWLPTGYGAVAAGAFFGLSSNLTWRSWYQVNLALGALFLPLVLAAVVHLRRTPGRRQAIVLGLVLGAALLTDQESAALAAILAGLALLPWLLSRPALAKLRLAALAATASAVVASPQIIAMIWQAAGGGARTPPDILAHDYVGSGVGLVQMFAPSPRLAGYGMGSLAALYYHGRAGWVVIGYGLMVSLAALAGLVIAWRRQSARLLGLLWCGCSVLALGPVPWIVNRTYYPLAFVRDGVRMSALMPFTWFVRIPGLANFREAARFTELGLVAAALLAGAAAGWLGAHARPLLVVLLALGILEAGWSGNDTTRMWPIGVMPTALPALDAPIAADHSHAIVVDVPFGIRGGLPVAGRPFPPESMVLATADGHPLADAYVSRIPPATLAGIVHRPFYAALMRAQTGQRPTPAEMRAARRAARLMHIGWVLVWPASAVIRPFLPDIRQFLPRSGFRLAYRADGVWVYRRVPGGAGAGVGAAASSSRPSAARPRTRPRSPAARPARSSAVRPASSRA